MAVAPRADDLMPYPSAAVANSFLEQAKAAGAAVDPLKLQKLVYFGHGWHLAYDQGALSAEDAQAWSYGPVFPDLYHSLKSWGSGAVLEPAAVFRVAAGTFRWETPQLPSSEHFSLLLIKRVWEVYGKMSGLALSQLTHAHDGPWQVTRAKNPGIRGPAISNELIRQYFQAQLRANAERH